MRAARRALSVHDRRAIWLYLRFTLSFHDVDAEAREFVAWAESNAVIFANSVLGARTAKHPDFLDLCIALTGGRRYPRSISNSHRKARRVIEVEPPKGADEAFLPFGVQSGPRSYRQ